MSHSFEKFVKTSRPLSLSPLPAPSTPAPRPYIPAPSIPASRPIYPRFPPPLSPYPVPHVHPPNDLNKQLYPDFCDPICIYLYYPCLLQINVLHYELFQWVFLFLVSIYFFINLYFGYYSGFGVIIHNIHMLYDEKIQYCTLCRPRHVEKTDMIL